MAATAIRETWPNVLYDLLRKNGVIQFAYVPDAGYKVLIDQSLADPDVHSLHVVNSEADLAEGRRLVWQGGDLTFILLRVKERPATHDGKKNRIPRIERDRFRAALLG